MLEDDDIAKVIDSFHSDEAKLQYLELVKSEEERISVIAHFKLHSFHFVQGTHRYENLELNLF